jgi:hypothetical protein
MQTFWSMCAVPVTLVSPHSHSLHATLALYPASYIQVTCHRLTAPMVTPCPWSHVTLASTQSHLHCTHGHTLYFIHRFLKDLGFAGGTTDIVLIIGAKLWHLCVIASNSFHHSPRGR